MKVTRDNATPIELTLTVELEPEDENPFLERSYRRTVSRINIPGFRRGKAPRRIVESMVGRTALLQEALDFMVPETLDKVLTDEEVSAFAEPSIEVTELEPVSFTATIPLEPTIDLGDYRSLRIESEPVEVGEEQVDDVISRLQEEQAV
ncbi:MAG: trigger factor family protein [Chloroflexi bacterium]|nr:trigger factor family protein [Chloroflexota bacterium]